jgi:hypothetical protein
MIMFFTNDRPMEIKALRVEPFVNACDLVTAVPTSVLRTNLEGRFWEAMENAVFEPWEGASSSGLMEKKEPCHTVAGGMA